MMKKTAVTQDQVFMSEVYDALHNARSSIGTLQSLLTSVAFTANQKHMLLLTEGQRQKVANVLMDNVAVIEAKTKFLNMAK